MKPPKKRVAYISTKHFCWVEQAEAVFSDVLYKYRVHDSPSSHDASAPLTDDTFLKKKKKMAHN